MQTNETTLRWTAGNGSAVEVEAKGNGHYAVRVAGEDKGQGYLIVPPKQSTLPAPARAAGMVGYINADKANVFVTPARASALKDMDKAITEAATAAYRREHADEIELGRLEDALHTAQDKLTRYGYGDTGYRGTQVDEARAAVEAWRAAHPELWGRIAAERQAKREREQARKQAEYEQSFVARGLD